MRPFFPFYVDDWTSSSRVLRMTRVARSVFVEALCIQWREGAVPTQIKHWRRIFPDVSDDDLAEVMAAFPDGKNLRMEREREIADTITRTRADAGRKGNAIRWGSLSDPLGIANDRNAQAQAQVQREASPSEKQPRAPRSGVHADAIRAFEEVWSGTRGTAYAMQAKDGVAMAKVVKLAKGDLREIKTRIVNLLYSTDAWMAQNASMCLLLSRWNQLAITVVPKPKGALQNLLDGMERMGMADTSTTPEKGGLLT